MDRERINRSKEYLVRTSSFKEFVDALNLPESYNDCHWLERDYRTLLAHGEVYTKSLMLPEAKKFEDFFVESKGEYSPSNTAYPGMYYLCGDTPDRPDEMFNKKGHFFKVHVKPSDEVIRMVETIFGEMRHTRSFEIIKWDNGKHLILVHHGSVISADGWLGVI